MSFAEGAPSYAENDGTIRAVYLGEPSPRMREALRAAQVETRIANADVVHDSSPWPQSDPIIVPLARWSNRAWLEHGRRTVVALEGPEYADALNALQDGADDVVAVDDDPADLRSMLSNTREVREAGGIMRAPRLAELSADVARIARALDGLAQEPSPEAKRPPPSVDAQQVRAAIRARRDRNRYFPGDLFADPAWDMLLDLMAARLEERVVSVSSLCIAAAVPPTTALRWIKTMTDTGLMERKPDRSDGRRIFIDLTERAASAMDAYLTRAAAMPGGLMAA